MSKYEIYFTFYGERLPTNGIEKITISQAKHMTEKIKGLKLVCEKVDESR